MHEHEMPPGERAAFANGRGAERERCAKLVEGEIYKERYRIWPGLDWGNRDRDQELVRFCDAMAALIRGQRT